MLSSFPLSFTGSALLASGFVSLSSSPFTLSSSLLDFESSELLLQPSESSFFSCLMNLMSPTLSSGLRRLANAIFWLCGERRRRSGRWKKRIISLEMLWRGCVCFQQWSRCHGDDCMELLSSESKMKLECQRNSHWVTCFTYNLKTWSFRVCWTSCWSWSRWWVARRSCAAQISSRSSRPRGRVRALRWTFHLQEEQTER